MTRLRSSAFALPPSLFRADRTPRGSASFRQAGPGRPGIARTCMVAVGFLLGTASGAFACPMCFGAEETSMVDGTKLGIFVMLAVTLAVQGGFVGFFLYLRKRAKRIAETDLESEWSQLQRVSRTS